MSDSIQVQPISPVASRPAVKREAATAVVPSVGAPLGENKSHGHGDQVPVEPVVAVEPSTHLAITRDHAANTFVYRSIDSKTGDVVWQYPREQALRMAHELRDLENHKVDEKI